MAAKADPEALKKNLFWILLGVFGAVWLIAVLLVKFTGDDSKKKAWEAAKQAINGAGNPKTEAYLKPWEAHALAFQKHKDKIWADGWQQQKSIYRWPAGMKTVPVYPQDPLSQNVRGEFRELYAAQFDKLDQQVAPARFRGGFEAVFPRQEWKGSKEPSREEVWLAEEDFWVRQEMLKIVADAMSMTSAFREVKIDAKEKLPAGIMARRKFRSANWELDLLMERRASGPKWAISPTSTIRNVNRAEKTQSLASVSSTKGLPFRLYNANGASYVFRVASEPLAYDGVSKLGRTYKVDPVDLKQPFAVEQVLEWENSPVREVVAMAVPEHSHRTISWGLKINEELKKLDPDPVAEGGDAAAGGGAGGAPAGMPGSPGGAGGMPSGPGGPGGPTAVGGAGMLGGAGALGAAGGAAAVDATKTNSIPRPRYMHVTPQCRHLPIAMRLVVDQAHLQDVMAAIANSPLRIQVTQVAFHHVPKADLKGGTAAGGKKGGFYPGGPMAGGSPPAGSPPAGMPSRPASFMPMRGGPRMGSPGMAGPGMPMLPPPGGGFRGPEEGEDINGTGSAAGAAKVLDHAQLADITVYGVATLYEHFPARKKETTTTTNP